MNLECVILMAFLDLAAVVFNVRMLLSCFKDKTKYKFLQRGRILAICQWACQVTILVSDAAETWKGFASQHGEYCNIYRILSLSVMFFQACNLTAILTIYFERPVTRGHRAPSTKVKISAVLSLGCTGSVMIWWYNCLSPEIVSQMALIAVFAATVISIIVLVIDAAARNMNIQDRQEENTPEASLWKFCKETKRSVFFITLFSLFIMCLVVSLSGEPRSESTLSQDFEKRFALMEALYLVYIRYIVGIVLPLALSGLIDSSYEGKNEMKTILI